MEIAKEIHALFDKAKAAGKWFEYECSWQGGNYVRNTEMGYCEIIEQRDAKVFEQLSPDTFYEVVRKDDSEFSNHYTYYYDETDDAYFVVRKARKGGSGQ